MKRIITVIITIVLITIMLCACSQTTSGTITGKQHVDSVRTFMPVWNGTTLTMVSIVEPETWTIVVKDENGEKHTIEVSQDEFNKLKVGDKWEGGAEE